MRITGLPLASAALLARCAHGAVVFDPSGYSTSGGIEVTPEAAGVATANNWCISQENLCKALCSPPPPTNNTCDGTGPTFSYNCTCPTGGNSFNISDYSTSLPALECGGWIALCVQAHPNDAEGQAGCHSVVCGSKSQPNISTLTSSSSTSATATSSGSATVGSAGTSTASSTSSSAAIAVDFGRSYGLGALVAGTLAMFGLAL